METRENNLKVYLKQQMEEYEQECESIKALYADLLEHIEECRDQIRRQKEQEDPGFALLSPLGEQLKKDTSSARLEGQIEAYEKQKGKCLQQIQFYEKKVAEMREQLEEFAHNEELKAQWEAKLRAEQEAAAAGGGDLRADEPQPKPVSEEMTPAVFEKSPASAVASSVTDGFPRDNSAQSARTQADDAVPKEQLAAAVKKAVNEAILQDRDRHAKACAYLARKLGEIKEYVQLDPMRCRVEIDRLMQYVEQMEEGEGNAGR